MARIRTVKPEFFRHRRLYLAEQETQLPLRVAFAGLWTVADREGRFKWEPEELKLDCLPYDDLDFSRVLHALTTRGFVVKYASNGREFGAIPGFLKHQVINNREAPSILPEPHQIIDITDELTRAPRVTHASRTRHDLAQGEGKGREGNSSVPKGTADASILSQNGHDVDDPVKHLFDTGVTILTRAGVHHTQARSMVGKWRKEVGDEQLIGFLIAAGKATDPIAYVQGAIRKHHKPFGDAML